MKKAIRIFLTMLVLFIIGCSNNEVKESYKQEQYAIIRGMNASQEGKFSLAIEEYLKAYKANKQNIFTLRELALTYGKLGDYENSERFYKRILELEPKDSATLYNLSVLYYNQQNYQESLDLLLDIPVESLTPDIRKMIGFNYYRLKDNRSAYSELSKIYDQMYDDIEFAKVYGEVLLDLGRLGELHPFISKLYNENKNNFEVVYIYGRHLSESIGRRSEAEEVYKEYTINYGVSKHIIIELSRLAYLRADYNEAKKYMNLIPEKLRYDVDVLKMEYKIYDKLGDEAKVVEIEQLLSKVEKDW